MMNNSFEQQHPRTPDGRFASKGEAVSSGVRLDTLLETEEHAREEHINKLHQVIERHDPDPYAMKRVMNFSVWDTLPTEDTFKEWLLNDYNNVPPDGIECDDQVTLLVDSFRRLDQIMRDPDKRWRFNLSTVDNPDESS